MDGGELDIGVASDSEEGAGGRGFDFDVAHGAGVGSSAERVLGVALDFKRREICLSECGNEGGDRAIAGAANRDRIASKDEVGFNRHLLTSLDGPELAEANCAFPQDIGF